MTQNKTNTLTSRRFRGEVLFQVPSPKERGLRGEASKKTLIFAQQFMAQLVIFRHGQSTWNLENKFTGWVDVELTEKGIEEAKSAGE